MAPQTRLSALARQLNPSILDTENQNQLSTTQSRNFSQVTKEVKENNIKMSNQPAHPTLLIPGPIEFDDAVLQSMSHYRYVLYWDWGSEEHERSDERRSKAEYFTNNLPNQKIVKVMSAPPS